MCDESTQEMTKSKRALIMKLDYVTPLIKAPKNMTFFGGRTGGVGGEGEDALVYSGYTNFVFGLGV